MNRLKVRTKLLIQSGLLLGLLILASATGLMAMKSTVAGLETVYLDRVVPLRDLKEIDELYAVEVVDSAHKARNGNISLQEALTRIDKAQIGVAKIWQAYVQTKLVPEEERQVEKVKALMDKSAPSLDKLKSILKAGDRDGLAAFATNDLYTSIDPLSEAFGRLIEIQLEVAKVEYDAAESRYRNSSMILAVGGAIGLIAGIGLALLITRQITSQLGAEPAELAEIAERIAQGNLARPANLPAKPVGVMASVETMRNGLHSMIEQIVRSASVLGERAAQVSVASEQVMASSEVQSESTSSMAAAMEQLSVSISQITDNATETHDVAQRASTAGQRGLRAIESSVAEMDRIDTMVAESTQRVAQLAEASKNIGTIGQVIRETADLTNLLALNAAIEAARAGEQGRGFAVVADEVRKLAERTSLSTSEIVELVRKIQDNTGNTQEQISEVSATVRKGKELVREAGGMMEGVGQAISHSLDGVQNISRSLSEQRAASTQVAASVERVAQVVEENNAAQGSVNAATHDLQNLATELGSMVSHFKLS